jgi:hypothetical protein
VFFNKQLKLEFDSPSTAGNYRNYAKCVGFPWPPVVAAHDRKRVNDHCRAVKVIGSINITLMPRIQLCPSDPTIPFKLYRGRFLIKSLFLWQSIRRKGRRLCWYHRMINEYGTWELNRGNPKVTGEVFCSNSVFPHTMPWDWTRTSGIRSWLLTAWPMALKYSITSGYSPHSAILVAVCTTNFDIDSPFSPHYTSFCSV